MSPDQRPLPKIGILFAIASAVLFGASTPFTKLLLARAEPVLLAGLLYLGSGCGLGLWLLLGPRNWGLGAGEAPLRRTDLGWLAGAVLFGGVIAPLLLLLGLAATPAAAASLLLNLEGVLTAVLAWFVFKENFDRRIALGMVCITAGSVLLSWTDATTTGALWGALAVAGACLAWGIDNNLTRKVSGGNPLQIATVKGLVAGSVNLAIAFLGGATVPNIATLAAAALVGLFGYGVSLTFFVLALRYLGTARTGAYFSLAPFVGAALSLLIFQEAISLAFAVAVVLMGLGLWLHLTERHEHEHDHEPLHHEHSHVHDDHHRHEHDTAEHDTATPVSEPHTHPHFHPPIRHAHPHYPDIHHRHEH